MQSLHLCIVIPQCGHNLLIFELFTVRRKEEQIKELQLEIDQENRMAENLIQGMVSTTELSR